MSAPLTVAVTGLNATDNPGPGVGVIRSLRHCNDDVRVIGAFVVPKSGATPAADSIRDYAAARLAAYKCPREVRFIDALPRTPNGKVKRSALAELIHTSMQDS